MLKKKDVRKLNLERKQKIHQSYIYNNIEDVKTLEFQEDKIKVDNEEIVNKEENLEENKYNKFNNKNNKNNKK